MDTCDPTVTPSPCRIADTHFHLDQMEKVFQTTTFRQLEYKFQPDLLQLHLAIANYVYPASWSKIDLRNPRLNYSIGLHSHLISSVTIGPSFFLQHLKEPRCVGFGEIGLDYTTTCRCSSHRGKNEKKDCVKRKIRKQVKFLEHMLPLIPEDVVIVVHTNGEGAANDMIEILIKGRKTKQGIHWH